jgi:hypothetical protein
VKLSRLTQQLGAGAMFLIPVAVAVTQSSRPAPTSSRMTRPRYAACWARRPSLMSRDHLPAC